ncbi:hypothetical protein FHS05_002787, partial [Microbacterium endophyticum]|nr:hypothetical protein [Microbacterium halimionae]NIK37711.1 hypothetical protein [Microbacterium endophyticum]
MLFFQISSEKSQLDKRRKENKIEKLPCVEGREAGKWEHPILENSTACTC